MSEKPSEVVDSAPEIDKIATCMSHRGYSLVKIAYLIFAFVFIYWFSDSGWFDLNLQVVGLPIILFVIGLSHFMLIFLESQTACRIYSLIFKGKPPTFYLNWINLHKFEHNFDGIDTESNTDSEGYQSFSFGLKKVGFSVIDELELTIWGNLLIKSSKLQGGSGDKDSKYFAEVLAKLPAGAVSNQELSRFVELCKKHCPDLLLNKRLSKRLDSKVVKGEELVKSLGAIFLIYVLLDLGYGTGYLLEMQKHYFLSQAVLVREDIYPEIKKKNLREEKARQEFELGEAMFKSPPGLSLVRRALFDHGSAIGGVYQAKAKALWELGEQELAIKALEKAHELYPKSLKLMIEIARWKYSRGDIKGTKEILEKACDEHSEDMLPRLYIVAADKKSGVPVAKLRELYKKYLEELDDNVFGDQPWWPPGGNRFLSERLYRQDVEFLASLLLNLED